MNSSSVWILANCAHSTSLKYLLSLGRQTDFSFKDLPNIFFNFFKSKLRLLQLLAFPACFFLTKKGTLLHFLIRRTILFQLFGHLADHLKHVAFITILRQWNAIVATIPIGCGNNNLLLYIWQQRQPPPMVWYDLFQWSDFAASIACFLVQADCFVARVSRFFARVFESTWTF